MSRTVYPDILKTPGLVFQKDPANSELVLRTHDGGVLEIAKDGCALISLYNAQKICGSTMSFSDFGNAMLDGMVVDCSGQISWTKLNSLDLNLSFDWMQDEEFLNCDKVDYNRIKECGLEKNATIALIKVKSLSGIADRRHFMVLLKATDTELVCLESSGKSGYAEERVIRYDEVLGVRYLKRK